ncbi:MAG TPA: glycosyltransferase, partial [Lysobacter sp.]
GIEPERIVTIGAGVDARFAPPAPDTDHRRTLRERFGIERPFVLYNGGVDKRKNVEVLFRGFGALPRELRDNYQLVAVGRIPPETRQRFEKLAHEASLQAADVVFTGYVGDDDLVALYQACALFVFPSEREGFGLPPLEAMACGAPVLANDATSLPEVVGDPSALFDASRPEAITLAMQTMLNDPQRQRQLRQAGLRRAATFTWARVAERALEAIERTLPFARPRIFAPVAKGPVIAGIGGTERLAGGVPTYRLSADNVAALLPVLRRWPGAVEWSGPLPAPGSMSAADRYRVHGYAGLGMLEQPDDWRMLLLCDATGWRDGEAAAASSANHLLARQRLVEEDIATNLASGLDDNELAAVADALDRLRPRLPHRWLVDVTHIAGKDLGTGIQRVVRSILRHWLSEPPAGIRIEPVAFRDGRYHHAHAYACGLLGIADPGDLPGDIVAITGNESFIGLDWAMESLPSAAPLLRTWRHAGVSMHFVVNDILPETLPEAFHQRACEQFRLWLDTVAELADAVHCISRTTANEFGIWLVQHHPDRQPRIDYFPLGVDR